MPPSPSFSRISKCERVRPVIDEEDYITGPCMRTVTCDRARFRLKARVYGSSRKLRLDAQCRHLPSVRRRRNSLLEVLDHDQVRPCAAEHAASLLAAKGEVASDQLGPQRVPAFARPGQFPKEPRLRFPKGLGFDVAGLD